MSNQPHDESEFDPADEESAEQPNILPTDTSAGEQDLLEADAEEFDDEFETEDEEFSLDQLTEAYAKVIQGKADDALNAVANPAADPTPGRRAGQPNAAELSGAPATSKADSSDPEEQPKRDQDAEDNAPCPVSPESIVEAILFVGAPKDVKLTTRKIAAVLRDVSPKEVSKIVKQLNQRYETEHAVYRIKNDKGNLQMHLHESMNEFQQEFFGRNRPVRLTQHAIDVMAVVAYNQPVTREQIDKIRGKSSGSILSQLVRRKLIEVAPAEEFQDKQRRYSTTEKFLDLFHLDDLADLPQSHEVSDIEELAD